MSKYAESVLAGISLEELRAVRDLADRHLYDRQCQSFLGSVGRCTAEPPHADGWHEHTAEWANQGTHPAHTGTPHIAVVRWRFADDVVALEHEHEERRRPGAN